jgi:hypothetical protein
MNYATQMTHVKSAAEAEMSTFDSLHPMIREVLREGDCTVYLEAIFQRDPELRNFARTRPYEFALKLKRQLKKWSQEDHINGMAEIKRAAHG